MSEDYFDVIIVGAGASGLMAAIHAAKRGRQTLVIDHADRAGKKMLLSGGGKCNITNRHISVADYFGADNTFCKPALKRFSTKSVLHFLQEAFIKTEERERGRIFCKNSANEIVNFLVCSAEQSGVHFLMNAKMLEARCENNVFIIKSKELQFVANHLLIATGGLACPQVGATGIGYEIAQQFGHSIIPLKPALAGFILPNLHPLLNLQGISLPVQLQIKGKNKTIEEPLLFTHQGISGPAALQVSCFWEKGDTILIDFLPADDVVLQMHYPENGKYQVNKLITGFLPERLARALIPEYLSGRKVAELCKADRKTIAGHIHSYPVTPDDVESYTKAEVTTGGVSTCEINPQSMESLLLKGLFFSGEVIDITGKLGGYNIHWALASGVVAGQNM